MYYVTPNHAVPVILKVASSSLARAIIKQFYPQAEAAIQNAHYPAGHGPDDRQWHAICPKASKTDLPKHMLIRDPVERFRSAMAQLGLSDPGEVIDAIQADTRIEAFVPRRASRPKYNPHFVAQETRASGEVHLYRFPGHLEQFASAVGLDYPLPTINTAIREKPLLTPTQETAVRGIYADDVALYAAAATPGTIRTLEDTEDPTKAASDAAAVKAKALVQLEGEYRSAGEQGVLVDGSDLATVGSEVRMRYVPEAVANYQEAANLLQLAGKQLSAAVLWDAAGNELQVSVADAIELLSRYAVSVAQAKVAYMRQQSAIQSGQAVP